MELSRWSYLDGVIYLHVYYTYIIYRTNYRAAFFVSKCFIYMHSNTFTDKDLQPNQLFTYKFTNGRHITSVFIGRKIDLVTKLFKLFLWTIADPVSRTVLDAMNSAFSQASQNNT